MVRSLASSRAAVPVGLAALTGLTVALRLPFLGSIGPDEGGYAYVASEWAHGDQLYRTIWIDQPQGLLLVYRLLLIASSDRYLIGLAVRCFFS